MQLATIKRSLSRLRPAAGTGLVATALKLGTIASRLNMVAQPLPAAVIGGACRNGSLGHDFDDERTI